MTVSTTARKDGTTNSISLTSPLKSFTTEWAARQSCRLSPSLIECMDFNSLDYWKCVHVVARHGKCTGV